MRGSAAPGAAGTAAAPSEGRRLSRPPHATEGRAEGRIQTDRGAGGVTASGLAAVGRDDN